MRFIVVLFYFIPKNLLSKTIGFLAGIPLKGPIGDFIKSLFVKLAGIDILEASKELSEYRSIQEIFTRKLVKGLRPIAGEIVSPCDGSLLRSEKSEKELAIQIKKITYRLDELVFGYRVSNNDFGFFQTIYLAPHNYHRVHTPIAGTLVNLRYIPGKLWPVNLPFVHHFPNLYVENERLVYKIRCGHNSFVYLVMVAALNVGKITPRYCEDFHEKRQSFKRKKEILDIPINESIKAGDEMGTFELGSTVVLIYENGILDFDRFKTTQNISPIKLGDSLLKIGEIK